MDHTSPEMQDCVCVGVAKPKLGFIIAPDSDWCSINLDDHVKSAEDTVMKEGDSNATHVIDEATINEQCTDKCNHTPLQEMMDDGTFIDKASDGSFEGSKSAGTLNKHEHEQNSALFSMQGSTPVQLNSKTCGDSSGSKNEAIDSSKQEEKCKASSMTKVPLLWLNTIVRNLRSFSKIFNKNDKLSFEELHLPNSDNNAWMNVWREKPDPTAAAIKCSVVPSSTPENVNKDDALPSPSKHFPSTPFRTLRIGYEEIITPYTMSTPIKQTVVGSNCKLEDISNIQENESFVPPEYEQPSDAMCKISEAGDCQDVAHDDEHLSAPRATDEGLESENSKETETCKPSGTVNDENEKTDYHAVSISKNKSTTHEEASCSTQTEDSMSTSITVADVGTDTFKSGGKRISTKRPVQTTPLRRSTRHRASE